jgi:hypothetical protein
VDLNSAPTFRLLAGLAVTLCAVAIYSGYTILQLHGLRELQSSTIDHDRTDSLLLLRIQNDLNTLAVTMRDMADANEPYPFSAWKGQFRRIHLDLDDALSRERTVESDRTPDQRHSFTVALAQFWDSLDRVFAQAEAGAEAEARTQIRLSLEARLAALSVQNNENEQESGLVRRHPLCVGPVNYRMGRFVSFPDLVNTRPPSPSGGRPQTYGCSNERGKVSGSVGVTKPSFKI